MPDRGTRWYIVWRVTNTFCKENGRVGGFIYQDDEEMPLSFDTREEAQEALRGHILSDLSEIIEL